jgi:hypothetical protein
VLAVFVKETKGLEFGRCGKRVVFRANEGFSSYSARLRQCETRKYSGCGERVIFLVVFPTKVWCFGDLVSSFFVTHICSKFERVAIRSRHFQFEMDKTFLYSLARYSLQVMLWF